MRKDQREVRPRFAPDSSMSKLAKMCTAIRLEFTQQCLFFTKSETGEIFLMFSGAWAFCNLCANAADSYEFRMTDRGTWLNPRV